MAEILIKAVSQFVSDPTKDLRGSYKRGMPVVVMPDGHVWGTEERLPNFVVLKIPLIPVARIQRFIEQEASGAGGNRVVVRRRAFRISWADLPLAARNKLSSQGELTIKATAEYLGAFDYTWSQVRNFFVNQATGLPESGEL